jgi:hypothetical protein
VVYNSEKLIFNFDFALVLLKVENLIKLYIGVIFLMGIIRLFEPCNMKNQIFGQSVKDNLFVKSVLCFALLAL